MKQSMSNTSDLFGLVKTLKHIIFAFIILVIVIVMAFLYYISNACKDNYQDIDADGVYNLVDANGNVISTDLTSEDIAKIIASEGE